MEFNSQCLLEEITQETILENNNTPTHTHTKIRKTRMVFTLFNIVTDFFPNILTRFERSFPKNDLFGEWTKGYSQITSVIYFHFQFAFMLSILNPINLVIYERIFWPWYGGLERWNCLFYLLVFIIKGLN